MLRVVAAAVVLPALCACGSSLTLKTGLEVVMVGVLEQATAATGNADPKFEGFVLQSASLTKADGTLVSVYAGPDLTLRIIDRPQIIADKDLTAFAGDAFTGATVTLGPTVTGAGKYDSSLSAAITAPALTYTQAIDVTQGQVQQLTINVQWENSIARDDTAKTEALQQPSFVLDLGSN